MMHRLRTAAFGLVLVAAACGGSDPAGTTRTEQAGSFGDAMEVTAGAAGRTNEAACRLERRTLETAIEAYWVLNGKLPASADELLTDRLITELSELHEITADGQVVAVAEHGCP